MRSHKKSDGSYELNGRLSGMEMHLHVAPDGVVTGTAVMPIDKPKIARAAKSIAQTSIGLHVRPDEEQTRIKAICAECDLHTKNKRGGLGRCSLQKGGCGCVLTLKIKDDREHCPKGKW